MEVAGLDLGTATSADLDVYRQRTIGTVLQDSSSNLLPYLTARRNIALPLELAGLRGARQRADELLDLVGLSGRAEHRPLELSGGEQQRVALAVALAHEPTVLLADEPTGALDSASTEDIFSLMRTIGGELGLTQVIVSHDPELARHVDRVVAIRDGRVASEQRWVDGDGRPGEIDEVLVVDTIGRLQLTEDQLDLLDSSRRVRAEIVDGVIEIRRAGEDR